MPLFTIERTYDVPHYRQETYEAPDLETALKMDAENDDWEFQKTDWDCCGPERLTGAWQGDRAYIGPDLLHQETEEVPDYLKPLMNRMHP